MKKQYLTPEVEITWVNPENAILSNSVTSGSNANLTIDSEASSENYWSY
jgi:hypothetical protein